jgi:hypothetical protein
MLIPNKFNGYSRDGIRKYNVGGGVGEAMLIGAALGGGSAAVTGGDPLKGAMLGGLTGGAGGAMFGGAAAGAGGAEAALASAGTEAATSAAMANALPVSTMAATPAATAGLPAGQSFAQASQLANNAAANQAVTGAMNQALPLSANAGISSLPAASSAAPGAGAVPAATATAPAVNPTMSQQVMNYAKANPIVAGGLGITALSAMTPKNEYEEEEYNGPLSRFRFNPDTYRPARGYAGGGITALAGGGDYDMVVGEQPMYQTYAAGGISNLGSYSDGGRMLKGPGDGMSDSIPASIANKRPARLARDEFVVPADVVSHLGNGSSDAGAKQLYAMMDRVRKARTGTKKQGKEINAGRFVPA